MKQIITIALILISLIGYSQDTIVQDSTPRPAYLLLTYGEYFKLNHDLSIAKGWKLGDKTERCKPMQPQAAKINITYGTEGNETGYDEAYVMRISSKEQQDYPELFTGLELHSSYVPFDSVTTEIAIEGEIEPDVIDWTLNHYQRFGIENEKLRTYIAGQDASIYPPIPAVGEWCEAKVYSYNGDKVKCLQPHTRMNYTPEETPALWTVIKTVSNYDDVEIWDGNNYLAYQTVGYLVKYNNKIWASKLPISHTWIAPALEGDGAISWEFVADI